MEFELKPHIIDFEDLKKEFLKSGWTLISSELEVERVFHENLAGRQVVHNPGYCTTTVEWCFNVGDEIFFAKLDSGRSLEGGFNLTFSKKSTNGRLIFSRFLISFATI